MDNLVEPIRVLSDIHLGHPACRLRSVEPLRPILAGAKTVIFNGDTWEKSNVVLRDRAGILYKDLLNLLDELEITPVFIRGNHDPLISEIDSLDMGDTFITHGDCLFETISPWNPKTWELGDEYDRIRKAITGSDLESLMGYTQRCRLIAERDEHRFRSGRFRILKSIFKIVFPPRRPLEILRSWKETPNRADQFREKHCPNAKTLIIGHLHRPGVWKRSDGYKLINTGGYMSIGRAQVVEINQGKVSVFKVDESNPESFKLKAVD